MSQVVKLKNMALWGFVW